MAAEADVLKMAAKQKAARTRREWKTWAIGVSPWKRAGGEQLVGCRSTE
jgi:hypothetical protein